MGLETGTYPSDFTTTNPTGGDPRSELDDHIRLVKACTKAALPIGAPVYPLTTATVQATTSGTSIDFTGIPSWAKGIRVLFNGVSTNANSTIVVQLGDSGGIEATGYTSVSASIGAAVSAAASTTTSIPIQTTGAAGGTVTGELHINLLNAASFLWTYSGVISSSVPNVLFVSGSKATSAALDRVRITTVGGDTFDAGSIVIVYE